MLLLLVGFNLYTSFLGCTDAIVVTEETVRGIDFIWLECVLLMNVPRSASEYLHICGRVGRLGQPGQAVTIVDPGREMTRMQSLYRQLEIVAEDYADYLIPSSL